MSRVTPSEGSSLLTAVRHHLSWNKIRNKNSHTNSPHFFNLFFLSPVVLVGPVGVEPTVNLTFTVDQARYVYMFGHPQ